jgi:Alpha-2,8-polysialyltransferase (POLYST)
MSRLVLVHGPWQLLLVASALKQAARISCGGSQDDLVVVSLHDGPLPAPIREVLGQIAPAVWSWRRVIVIDNAIDWNEPDPMRPIEALRHKLGPGEPDEVWLDCLWGRSEKIAAEAYPAARLVLYEDGLHTYLPMEDYHLSMARCLREPRMAYRALKTRIRQRRAPRELSLVPILPRHLARVAASYLWISLMLEPASYQQRLPWVQLQTRFLKETIDQVSGLVDGIALEGGGGPQAIVLGQCFSNYGDLARDIELDCYIDMVRRMRQRGYEVIWKEHPRTRQPFLSELVAAVPGVRGLPELGPWPIELHVERLGLAACASLTSTALFSIPLLFGLPAYSAVGRCAGLFRFPDDALARLVVGAIPPIDEGGSAPQARPATTGSARPRAGAEPRFERASENVA